MKKGSYKSMPKGSLVYVKDFSQKPHKKVKQRYFRAPQKVISEYRCVVYTIDLLGKVRKHSKNNVKLASPRSVELFGALPPYIQAVLGEPLNSESWNEICNYENVPQYLLTQELEFEKDQILRGRLPKDTDLISDNKLPPQKDDDEDEMDIDDLLGQDEFLTVLQELHSQQKLTPQHTIRSILQNRNNIFSSDRCPSSFGASKNYGSRILRGIDKRNILSHTRKRVTFNPSPQIFG